jgi:lipopolysaccharide export LptBFGC system permease protein LptF
MRFSFTITRYVLWSVLPYFLFSWALLSVILFVQQAGRFSDIFFSSNIPAAFIWQLSIALVPNVIAFTCPMAAIVGVVIGLTRMQRDGELVAIRAAGVGTIEITIPAVFLGALLSVFAFVVNSYGIPLAAGIVRTVTIQTAIKKLESPIEPGVFNTEIAGYTVYVRDVDFQEGSWKNIFIHAEDPRAGTVRLITSSDGRIDSSGDRSELVLGDAVSFTFWTDEGNGKVVSERLGEVRFAIQTGRSELIEKLRSRELSVAELGLAALADYAGRQDTEDSTEAGIILQRRLLLSITPLIFCMLGAVLVLRFNRRGRGFSIVLALLFVIGFYMFAFLGEQLARTGRVGPLAASLLPIAASVLAIGWFSFFGGDGIFSRLSSGVRGLLPERSQAGNRPERRNYLVDLTAGLRDFDITIDLARYFLLTLAFLATIFVVFTAFELWRFAGTTDGGFVLLLKYLLFLMPFVYIQLAPTAAMVATLATYVIKSRQNEIITWISAGQSVYRLLVPCFILMLFLGAFNWQFQETFTPRANQIQDGLRDRIRSRGRLTESSGAFWVANDRRIYSIEIGETKDPGSAERPDMSASDNEMQFDPSCPGGCEVRNIIVYEFGERGSELQTVYRSDRAVWESNRITFPGNVQATSYVEGSAETVSVSGVYLDEEVNPFLELLKKPSQMTIGEIRRQIANSESVVEKRNLSVALEKRYTTIVLPFIIALFTAPFALSLSRKGKVVTVGYAIGLWLLFMGMTSVFEQLGLNGSLSPGVAVWGPLGVFSAIGIYLISKVRT